MTLRVFRPDPAAYAAEATKVRNSDESVAFAVSDTGVGIPKTSREWFSRPSGKRMGPRAANMAGRVWDLRFRGSWPRCSGVISTRIRRGEREYVHSLSARGMEKGQREAGGQAVLSARRARTRSESPSAPMAKKAPTVQNAPQSEKPFSLSRTIPSFSKVLSVLAQERGFKSVVAIDGERGLELLETAVPSGILLDLKLPGIDGLSVLERIKANPKTRHIPVHIISGAETADEALRKGAIGFLQKPVAEADLRDAFTRIESLASGK